MFKLYVGECSRGMNQNNNGQRENQVYQNNVRVAQYQKTKLCTDYIKKEKKKPCQCDYGRGF